MREDKNGEYYFRIRTKNYQNHDIILTIGTILFSNWTKLNL